MPHFLLGKQAEKIQSSKARKIMIFNLPDKNIADEYSGFSLQAHLQLVLDHIPDLNLDVALVDKNLLNQSPDLTRSWKLVGERLWVLT